jgi:hypothetical protein
VIGVAATDVNDRKASFSNYGSPAQIAAPGEALISSYPASLYAAWSGTSAAAALVSGEAAFLLSQQPLTADQAASQIESKTDHLNDPPYQLGKGRIDLQSLMAGYPFACNGTLNHISIGDLNVSNGQTCIINSSSLTGNVTQNGGSLVLNGVTVGGNVQVQGRGNISILPSTYIGGNLQIQNLQAGTANEVCGANIKGNLQYQNNGAAVQIGASSGCPGNTIQGDLEIGNNTAWTQVAGNTVVGNLQVQNNTGAATQVSNNAVTKSLQCQNNSSITGGGNSASQKQGQCSSF